MVNNQASLYYSFRTILPLFFILFLLFYLSGFFLVSPFPFMSLIFWAFRRNEEITCKLKEKTIFCGKDNVKASSIKKVFCACVRNMRCQRYLMWESEKDDSRLDMITYNHFNYWVILSSLIHQDFKMQRSSYMPRYIIHIDQNMHKIY